MAKRTTKEDKYLGHRFRIARMEMGYTQRKIGKIFNLCPQQIQKLEAGTNRLPAKSLYKMAQLSNRELHWFFTDFTTNTFEEVTDYQQNNRVILLIQHFRNIENEKIQKYIFELIKSIDKSH